MLISSYYINDFTYLLNEQIKNKEENGFEWVANFFAQEKFIKNDFIYLEDIMDRLNIDIIYITISPRTRYWINTWEQSGKISTNRSMSYDIKKIAQPFKGEDKFKVNNLFSKYYENQAIIVYKYSISE